MKRNVLLVFRIVISFILLQTLYFKFSAHPDSVYIFKKVGLEPVGRIEIGVLELIAAILILIRKTIWAGALLTVGIISGAIFLHLTQLGIEINNDGGKLFYMALAVLILSLFVLWNYKKDIPIIGKLI